MNEEHEFQKPMLCDRSFGGKHGAAFSLCIPEDIISRFPALDLGVVDQGSGPYAFRFPRTGGTWIRITCRSETALLVCLD